MAAARPTIRQPPGVRGYRALELKAEGNSTKVEWSAARLFPHYGGSGPIIPHPPNRRGRFEKPSLFLAGAFLLAAPWRATGRWHVSRSTWRSARLHSQRVGRERGSVSPREVILVLNQYKCIGCSPGKHPGTRTMVIGLGDDSRDSAHDRCSCIVVWPSERPRRYERQDQRRVH